MVIGQADIYWIDLGDPSGSGPGGLRPCLIVQNNVLNSSRMRTTIVCVLTTTVRLATMPGNVLLRAGEGNLPESSVANVTQLLTVDKKLLQNYIGTISMARFREVLRGLQFVFEPREPMG